MSAASSLYILDEATVFSPTLAPLSLCYSCGTQSSFANVSLEKLIGVGILEDQQELDKGGRGSTARCSGHRSAQWKLSHSPSKVCLFMVELRVDQGRSTLLASGLFPFNHWKCFLLKPLIFLPFE
jgi:hypothetical protein